MRNEQHDEAVDVSASPELWRLAEEVRSTGKPLVLRNGTDMIAVVVPYGRRHTPRPRRRPPTERDIAAFRSAAGSWSEVDVDRFLAETYAARDVPDERPPVEL
jgi:hypothetical protein